VGGGRLNWYHFFVVRSVSLLAAKGHHGFITPLSLLADQFTRSLRTWILRRRLLLIEGFPQKDDANNRVFREAKLPTCIYIVQQSKPEGSFSVRVHPGKDIAGDSPSYVGELQDLLKMDPTNVSIPLVSSEQWDLLKQIFGNKHLGRMRECGALPTSGEIVFNEAFRRYLTEEPTETLVLRGSHVQRWEIVESAKQGEPMYLKKQSYLKNAREGSKAFHFRQPRVVYQECEIDNWRRVIAAYLPAGSFCGHKICYFTDYKCSPMALLAIFNSRLVDWLVTVLSSNNSLPAYLVGSIPFPRFVATRSDHEASHYEKLVDLYTATTRNNDALSGFMFSAHKVGADLRTPCQGLHDFFAYLGGRMIELNTLKQAEVRRFLLWLESELNIEPDTSGNTGIDALNGKTIIKGYLGDYQKRQSNHSVEALLEILRKNARRIRGTLDIRFERGLQNEFEKSLSLLLPIKKQLSDTDWLIDRLVYEVYGLTEEEIAAVEKRG
jgi:hypothetical protein